MDKNAKIALGVGGAVLLVVILAKAAKGATPPAGNLVISLSNVNPLATVWEIMLFDHTYTKILSTPANGLPVNQAAAFDIPADWQMPLKFNIAVFKDTVPGVATGLTQIVGVQDYNATQYFTGQPDPTYKPIFINTLGNVVFNCSTLNFS